MKEPETLCLWLLLLSDRINHNPLKGLGDRELSLPAGRDLCLGAHNGVC